MDIYTELDNSINAVTGGNIGYTTLVAPEAKTLDTLTAYGYESRPAIIQEFFASSLNVFRLALSSQLPKQVLHLLTGDTPASLGTRFHRSLSDQHFRPPVFYRTDETSPGCIVEIQCPGSMWGECLALQEVLGIRNSRHDERGSIATAFCSQLTSFLGSKEPLIHHLIDNSSLPHGVRYFIQMTRSNVRYFGYDRSLKARDCNFVRTHSFYGLAADNHFIKRLDLCANDHLQYDLPPICLFDQKVPLALPFWSKTREFFTDAVRNIICFSTPVLPEGIELRDGRTLSLEQFSMQSQSERRFYLKYAGTDVSMNWGGMAVYRLNSDGRDCCLRRLRAAANDARKGRYWILQEASEHKESFDFLARDGTKGTSCLNVGYRSFNGPYGLMGVVALARTHFKVHGQDDTVMIAFSSNEK